MFDYNNAPTGTTVTTETNATKTIWRKMKNGQWRENHGNIFPQPYGTLIEEGTPFKLQNPPAELYNSQGMLTKAGKQWLANNR